MQNIISKGKSVEEAIQLGLNLLETTAREVDIEVIQQATSGFIGIGRKEAIVKLSLVKTIEEHDYPLTLHENDENKTPMLLEEMDFFSFDEPIEIKEHVEGHSKTDQNIKETELAGKVWIKDNQLFVKDSLDHFPIVRISNGVKLYKNNKLVKETSTVITEKEQVEIQLDEPSKKETKWKVTIENNGLAAVLEVVPGYEVTRKLKDVEPSDHIELTVEELKEIINTLEYKDIIEELNNLQINYGIDHSEIIKATTATERSKFVIAKGRNIQPGSNGWNELKVEINPRNGLVEDKSGNVDFRETKLIPIVEKGKVLAIIHPPSQGIPGISVTNAVLPVKECYPIKLVIGKGVVELDGRLIASESGRPIIEQRGQLVKAMIVPKLVHRENVNLASGNIRFIGDIEIIGEVEDNMQIEAGGDIFVHKSVSKSILTTSNSIVVKGNVIGSELSAGKNNMLIAELGHLLGVIYGQLEMMIVSINQLIHSPAFKSNDFKINGLQPIITILLETRFKNFLSYIKKYQKVIEDGKKYLEDENWLQVANANKQIFLTLSSQVINLDQLINLAQKMKELHEFSKIPVEPDAYITITDAINSSLYCSGDISIIGKGCINTRVHAGGQLRVTGAVRGGVVYGRHGVTLYETGSMSGTKTVVSVPHDQRIHITKALEGTVLLIGNVRYVLTNDKTNIIASLNQHEQIIVNEY
ncbi:FapA family protein [Bacillus sp. Marseille-P3661]|uniref:FapA family protein n=1 Tax=Bacillus sp. Marseille-P3661 TaxID=1936234 RepID=UPI000C83691B|nr:FapA family protein [Bacillus sp. Marseille-P3661]